METRQLTPATTRNDTQAPLLLSISGSFLLLSILLLAARLWSRLRPISNLKADDWTIIGATILAIVVFILQCLACHHGFGRRSQFVTRTDRSSALRLIWVQQVAFYWSVTLVKLSVALLLIRLKPGRYWKLFLSTIMVLLVLNVIVQTLFQFLQCRPFSVYWDPSFFARVKCFPKKVVFGNVIANSTFHVATDLIFSFMPITFIRKLHRPRHEKIFLSFLMGLGLIASAFAILRTTGLKSLGRERDFFRLNVMPTLWAALELEVALIAATMPTLKSFMQRALVNVGRMFYEEVSESEIRSKLVKMGFLGIEGRARKLSKPDLEDDAVATFGSPTARRNTDEFGDTLILEKEIGVEVTTIEDVENEVALEGTRASKVRDRRT